MVVPFGVSLQRSQSYGPLAQLVERRFCTPKVSGSNPLGSTVSSHQMAKKLFVGSLAWATTDESLRSAAERFGNVVSAQVVMERETGRSRGFGFIEMSTEEEAQAAIKGLDGTELDGRRINVSEAQAREERPRTGGGFGGGNRGGFGGGNRGGDRGGSYGGASRW